MIGSECLQILLDDPGFDSVTVLVRNTTKVKDGKLVEHIIDFDAIEDYAHLIKASAVFCCLGTTMKTAGSQDAFYKVDYTYTVKIAEIASRNGCDEFLVVSALGANPASRIYYNKVKGEMEEAIKKIPFKGIVIFRPSILFGHRKEVRTGERIGIAVMKAIGILMIGPFRKYRGIKASVVACAMVAVARQERTGIHILESDKIKQITKPKRD